jgi:site-specific recombinase XerD
VLYRAGLRLGEVLALLPRDLDPRAGTVNVRRGKGGKQRIVGLGPDGFAQVDLWIARRGELGIGVRAPLFCTLWGRPLQSGYVRVLLPRLARRAGIEKRVHAHGLRYAFATELATAGVSVHLIQQRLGYSNLSETARCISHLAPRQAVAAAQGLEWRLSGGEGQGPRTLARRRDVGSHAR